MRRALVVGAGNIAVAHAAALDAMPDVQICGVVEPDEQRRTKFRDEHSVPGFAHLPEALAELSPDVAHICTPHDRHVPETVRALAAGVHVICEKPVGVDLADAQQMADAAASAKAKVGICYQNRYNAGAQEAKKFLASGAGGKVLGAHANVAWARRADYYESNSWRGLWRRAGGGVLINQAIHTIDLLTWLLGDPVDVQGQASQRLLGDIIEVEDTAEAVLVHPDGAISTLYCTNANVVNRPAEIEIFCEEATLNVRLNLRITWFDGRVEWRQADDIEGVGPAYWGNAHPLLISDFYARLDDPEPFWISPSAALSSLRVVKTIQEASFDHDLMYGYRKDPK